MTILFQEMVPIITNLFVVLNTILILKYIFGRDMRYDGKSLAISGGAFLIFDIVVSVILGPESAILEFILIDLGLVFCVLFMTRSKKLISVILIIPAILFYVQTSSILTTIEMFIGLDKFHMIPGKGDIITPMMLICDPTLFIILLILIHKTDVRFQNTTLNALEIIILTVFSAVGYYATGLIEASKDKNRYYFIVSALIFFAFEILLLYAIYHRKRSGYYRKLSVEYRKQFESEYQFFKNYKASQEDTIRFRHDWKNHILLIRQMLANGEYNEAETYFTKLSEKTPEGNTFITSGCELADMMIAIKSEQMEQLNITFHFNGNLKALNQLEQVDCCILLSNLLDNAIEANEKIDHNRYITLLSHHTGTLLYLEIKNPSPENLRIENNRVISSKKTDNPCGIGLENVKAIIKKYDGECNFFTENGEYIFQLLIADNN